MKKTFEVCDGSVTFLDKDASEMKLILALDPKAVIIECTPEHWGIELERFARALGWRTLVDDYQFFYCVRTKLSDKILSRILFTLRHITVIDLSYPETRKSEIKEAIKNGFKTGYHIRFTYGAIDADIIVPGSSRDEAWHILDCYNWNNDTILGSNTRLRKHLMKAKQIKLTEWETCLDS